MSKNIVVFTGSFNPITTAHRIVLQTAVDKVNAEFGLFVITNDKYLTKKLLVDSKTPSSFHLSEEVRKDMIDSLSSDFSNLKFGGHELGNESPSTVKTLRHIQKEYKGYRIHFLIGADKLRGVQNWSNIEEIISSIGLIVFKRNGIDIDSIISTSPLLSKYRDNITILESTVETIGVSSTEVRNRFFKELDYSSLMDKGPYEIMKSFKPSDFKPVTTLDVIRANLEVGGRFGGNAARSLVYKDNYRIYKTLDKNLYKNSKVYTSKFNVVSNNNYQTKTSVVNEDCVITASNLINKGCNPAILNLASNVVPCGGFYKGSNAQEESLCYSSTLPIALYQFGKPNLQRVKDVDGGKFPNVYPLNINYGGIYTPVVNFFRNNIEKYYTLMETPFNSSVITVASLANKTGSEFNDDSDSQYFNEDGTLTKEGVEIESNKIRTIYRIALDNGHDSIVLGAFGCGVYNLLPEEVSKLFKDILEEVEFKNKFKEIVFAIYEGKGSSRRVVGIDGKFKPFYDLFN